jgi:nucleoside-diphosphate-sugar epimerase
MRIFVAGATGVIGRRVVSSLMKAGHSVTASQRENYLGTWLLEPILNAYGFHPNRLSASRAIRFSISICWFTPALVSVFRLVPTISMVT